MRDDITTWKFLAFCAVFGAIVGLGVIAYGSIVFISEPWDRCDGVPWQLWWGCFYNNRYVFQDESGNWVDSSAMWIEHENYSGWADEKIWSCQETAIYCKLLKNYSGWSDLEPKSDEPPCLDNKTPEIFKTFGWCKE